MALGGQGKSGIEVSSAEKPSSLKPTAKFVHDVITKHVAPKLRELNLISTVNALFRRKSSDIITEEVDSADPHLIECNLACRQLKSEILVAVKSEGPDPKRDAVLINYFERLLTNLNKPPVQKPAPTIAPQETRVA
jgi:hypothetical protein